MRAVESRAGSGPSFGRPSARIAFISTYPPTRCGLASFTQSLVNALAARRGSAAGLGVIRLSDSSTPPDDRESMVVGRVIPGSIHWAQAASRAAAAFDVVSIQHEYGIFGPADGLAIIDLLDALERRVMVTLHSIPIDPSPRQRLILEDLAARADILVVMGKMARQRLLTGYRADPSKVRVIPHGSHSLNGGSRRGGSSPTILTWGLLGPGKGIEVAILAMRRLRAIEPRPRYVICGQTHPNVLRDQGEAYRNRLQALAAAAGVDDMVRFESTFVDLQTLSRYLAEADLVLLPYDSRDQVTSGVLVEALGAGKPVVATAFPHAVELLAGGAGRVVPHRDPEAMAAAVIDLLAGGGLARARQVAAALAPSLSWPAVAAAFEAEASRLAHLASAEAV